MVSFYNTNLTHDPATWLGPNSRGNMYLDLHLPFPWLKVFYMDWELNIDNDPLLRKMVDWTPVVPIASVIIYLVAIFGIQKLMANRKPFDLKWPLAYWNLLLAVFSFIGMIRTVPHLLWLTNFLGFHQVACGNPELLYGTASIGFWCQAFVLSKLAELIDTLFIVLRKRPLGFLHWYHHATVLLFCWFTYVNENPGLTFIAMNYTVHSVMYFYYFLTAIKAWPKWLNPQFITLMQISQMVVGVACAIYYYHAFSAGLPCTMRKELLMACGVMYSTYLYLFAEFFVKRFIFKAKQAPGEPTKTVKRTKSLKAN
jgi:elongation of very long chain fatty acids protein 6